MARLMLLSLALVHTAQALRIGTLPALHPAVVASASLAPLPACAEDAISAAMPVTLIAENPLGFGDNVYDYYYGFLALLFLGNVIKNAVPKAIEEAKDYDRRGELANKMAAEARKRDRAAALEATKRSDPAYERLQAEKRSRETKKSGWKVFGD